MIICEKCFKDTEVISVIRNKQIKGNCSICHSKDIFIYDTNAFDDLSIMFDDLLSIYEPFALLPPSYPRSEIRMIKSDLLNNWNIFMNRNESDVYNIITAICNEKYSLTPELFDQPVGIGHIYNNTYLAEHSLLKTNSWDDFVTALKEKNRFHTHYLNLMLLDKFCSYIRKSYKKGTRLYRCRISSEDGIEKEEMGAPPYDKATDGRANAKGIRCLYLGDKEETTIYETRARAFDFVTVGTFELKEDIIVADLKRINQISPFIEGLDCIEHAINKEHLNKINDEMSKVMRRNDSVLDYVPTQYITDFIKSIIHEDENIYSGIEYKSVMYGEGYNLAIFYPELFECIETKVYRIKDLRYDKEIV